MTTKRVKEAKDRFKESFHKYYKKQKNGCWKWVGSKLRSGYGTFYNRGKNVRAHRISYERLVGPIPEGLEIDHLCRNILCVNPYHLEAVTGHENIRRALPFILPSKNPTQGTCKIPGCNNRQKFTVYKLKLTPGGKIRRFSQFCGKHSSIRSRPTS